MVCSTNSPVFYRYVCSGKNENTKKLDDLKLAFSKRGRDGKNAESRQIELHIIDITSNQAVLRWSVRKIVQFFPDICSGKNRKNNN